MPQLTSPRLPGVPLLQVQPTGPEYSRWRRHIKFALETKDSWKYCNGKCRMPMPEAGATLPNVSTINLQPSLLEERREWVRHDREVKLDIFLSLAEEVMQEVFDVGPPLPPPSQNAHEMLDALDERFAVFNFESYHHAFCHFLNLHIDQYPSIEDFNKEYLATLEDLLDHGQPLSNIQACSAYFSKLRCTQNPWVAKKLEEWHKQREEVDCTELLKESPPWSIIRPLRTKPSQNLHTESIPEEYLENSSDSDSDAPSEGSHASTISSISLHLGQTSDTTVQTVQSQDNSTQRHDSVATAHSQEITIHASSGDIAEIEPQAFRKELEKLPASAIPERGSSKNQVPGTSLFETADRELPDWLVSKKSVARRPLPPHDRPLPPLPPQVQGKEARSQPASPQALASASKDSSQTSLTALTRQTPPPTSTPSQPPMLRVETTRPTLRPVIPQPPLDIHPALRSISSSSFTQQLPTNSELQRPTVQIPPALTEQRRPSTSTPNLAIPWPSTPDVPPRRPHSSRAALSFIQAPSPLMSQAQASPPTAPRHSQATQEYGKFVAKHDEGDDGDKYTLAKGHSNASEISLPLQGTRDSAWDYLYESKGGYLINRDHSVSPISRVPMFEDAVVPRCVSPVHTSHAKTPGLGFIARLSSDSLLESSEEVREREKRHRKKKSWSVNVNLARFSAGKGVKEIV